MRKLTAAYVTAAIVLVATTVCPPAPARGGHPNAWQTGVDVAGFEGDVYSALNLSGKDAEQFGRFFSSALYGIALGDAYVKLSDGDVSGAVGTFAKASAEFAIGLSPAGAAYAAFKLITWAPPAFVESLIQFNTTQGFNRYRQLRTEAGGNFGLPEKPIDFTTQRYRNWRNLATPAFNQVWGDIESGRDFGAYCHVARQAIQEKKLAKYPFWQKLLPGTDYHTARAEVVTLDEIKTWTFANWEARIVTDVLSNYVPQRLAAARREMLATRVYITMRLADEGGRPVEIAEFTISQFQPSVEGDTIRIETFLGDIHKIRPGQQLGWRAMLKGGERRATGAVQVADILDHSNWKHATVLGVDCIKVDLGTVRVETGPREVKLGIRSSGVKNVSVSGPVQSGDDPDDGEVLLMLLPGIHEIWAGAEGDDGRPVKRMTLIDVPPHGEAEPPKASITVDSASAIADAGSLDAITSAIDANARKLRANNISPEEYNHAVNVSLGKAEGVVEQQDGTRKSVRVLAQQKAQQTRQQLQQQAQSDIKQRAEAARDRIQDLPQTVPDEYRRALTSVTALEAYVSDLMRRAGPTGNAFPHGPTKAIELTIQYIRQQRDTLDELLGPVAGDLGNRADATAAEAQAVLDAYQRKWALTRFGDRSAAYAVSSLARSTTSLAKLQAVAKRAAQLREEGILAEIDRVLDSLRGAKADRKEAVSRARDRHAALISRLDSYRTVTLTDSAQVAARLANCQAVVSAIRSLRYADSARSQIQDAEDRANVSQPARQLQDNTRAAERELADPDLQDILTSLGVEPLPEDPQAPMVVKVAKGARQLGMLQSRVRTALAQHQSLRSEYREFYRANEALIQDPAVDEEALRVPDNAQIPKPQAQWFRPGSTFVAASDLGDHAPYDFAQMNDLLQSARRDAATAGLMDADLTTIAVQLIEAFAEDADEYASLNQSLQDQLAPYAELAGTRAADDAALSDALNRGVALRRQFNSAVGEATRQGKAPFHFDKMNARTATMLEKADEAYCGLARSYYDRVAKAIEARADDVRELGDTIADAWSRPDAVNRFLWQDDFQKALTQAADLGPHATGSEGLNWRSDRMAASVVPGMRQIVETGQNREFEAIDELNKTRRRAQQAYQNIFSNTARLSTSVPEVSVTIKKAPSSPATAGKHKVADSNPAIGKIAWSPDGKTLAWHVQPGDLRIAAAEGGNVRHLEPGEGWFGGSGTSPAFSPNGLLLVHEGPWGGGMHVTGTDLNGNAVDRYTDRTAEIVFRTADGTGLQTMLTVNATEAGIGNITRLDVVPDGRIFIGWTSESQSGYGWLDPDTEQLQKVPVDGGTLNPDISADGKWITYTQKGTKRLMIVSADGGQPRYLDTIARDPAISPQGRWVAYCYGDNVRVIPAGGGEPISLFKWSGVSLLSWSPQGDAIAYRRFGEGSVGVWITHLK